MKVILVNGSPHEKGCTYTALNEIAGVLNEEGIDTEIFNLSGEGILPCRACKACVKLGRCVIDDKVNEFTSLAKDADGFVFGSPVHFAAASGLIKSFLDRAFYSAKGAFAFKPAACIVSARRAGTTAALDELNKYPLIAQMPLVGSKYWNMVHGNLAEEVVKDGEGMQTMRALARNMAWILKLKEAGEKMGITPPQQEEQVRTNFVR